MGKKHFGSESCTPTVQPITKPNVVTSGEAGGDENHHCSPTKKPQYGGCHDRH